jgi:phosphatidylglycerophosphate synthase
MNLHRTAALPDWESIPPAKRTLVQQLAAKTGGIVTPPNLISLIGFIIVLYGLVSLLQQEFLAGLIALLAGRLLDIVDGWVADMTGTKSPLGELIDAAIDKIGTFLTLIVLYTAGVSEWWLLTLLLVPQIIISLLSFYKRYKKASIHPTRIGKLSMAGLWASISLLLLAEVMGLEWFSAVTVVVTILSSLLGFIAFWQYLTGRG